LSGSRDEARSEPQPRFFVESIKNFNSLASELDQRQRFLAGERRAVRFRLEIRRGSGL
jgi:hypothetical protein